VDNQKKKLFQFLSFASRKAELLLKNDRKIKKGLTNDFKGCIIQHVKARASLR